MFCISRTITPEQRSIGAFPYEALAVILHTDRNTAKRWFYAWAYSADPDTLFSILQGDSKWQR